MASDTNPLAPNTLTQPLPQPFGVWNVIYNQDFYVPAPLIDPGNGLQGLFPMVLYLPLTNAAHIEVFDAVTGARLAKSATVWNWYANSQSIEFVIGISGPVVVRVVNDAQYPTLNPVGVGAVCVSPLAF
jgi:hypothetical protein